MNLAKAMFLCIAFLPFIAANAQSLAENHSKKGLTCISCHETDKPEPYSEVVAAKCFGCHPQQAVVEKFASYGDRNPHKNHLGEIECNLCHKGHAPASVYCEQCHGNFKLNIR